MLGNRAISEGKSVSGLPTGGYSYPVITATAIFLLMLLGVG